MNMSSSFDSVALIFQRLPRIESLLVNADQYWAHRPHNATSDQKPETLPEHVHLVNGYFLELTGQHNLDSVIDTLISNIVQAYFPAQQKVEIGNLLKRHFVSTVLFHDFGKVNENFQAHPKKMNNPAFAEIPSLIIETRHAKLGAYLYLYRHFLDITTLTISDPIEQRKLLYFTLLLSYPIIKHHGSRLLKPDGKAIVFSEAEIKCMVGYIDRYGWKYVPKLANELFLGKNLDSRFFDWADKVGFDFSILALLRLNFSLLTAADYLATSEYMNQAGVGDFGVLNQVTRQKLIYASRSSKSYNADAFRLADNATWQPTIPTERNNETLNTLRLEMAVQAVRQVRQHPEQRLFYLEAPTGGGKTNISALVTAELLRLDVSLNKMFYVFPFTTLITQTHKALQETWQLDDSQIGLLHSRGGFQQKEVSTNEGDYGKQWKNQLANHFAFFPVCLLTHIRFFDILKSNEKDSIYLMHRLANSVVVIDELQSYSPKHWDKILFWLDQYSRAFNIRFVLMSATLPRIDGLKVGLTQPPKFIDLLPNAKDYFQNPNFRDRVRFRFDLLETPNRKTPRAIEPTELAEAVLRESRAYADVNGRVFTIIEFIYKKSATDFANQIGQVFFDKVFVLSGTILEPRRREIINFLKRNIKAQMKVLLITTQVVEAGVDIDMDLGFKNISLIDSDEQLAGRVNRNVTKAICNVFLFKLNEPGILYKHDDRFDITRNKLTVADHKQILETKDFSKLYNQVLAGRNNLNQKVGIENFSTKYLPDIQQLDYESIHKNFQLIDQKNLSLFVPLFLPVTIEGEKVGATEDIFSKTELGFLEKNQRYEKGGKEVDGSKVWTLYRQLNDMKLGITESQVSKKIMQGILSKFTFSIFYTDTLKRNFMEFIDPDKSFEEYLYLEFYDKVYDYRTGLDMSAFGSSENAII
ncbi:CRISPR-associated helicase Cas3' [Spirosoma sp. KUDC1026]|uniref:CRISPR-associated helicase Cas3' n=1 Tax=Spirosoma sp. KUDC1026 TaxID=2745947 RepID=UPI00159BE211|nr:CRISPR-associated helicase Cas3' [Spirosoma sp. KUDC1026]QKZ14677.1 CRISPR-associated helicase Cas3' [Spirosoma sp. KUDC1026]